MNKTCIVVLAAGTLACLLLTWFAREPALAQEKAPAPAPPKWEYKLVQKGVAELNEKELNELGAAGWELTGTISFTIRTAPYGEFVFKRPKH